MKQFFTIAICALFALTINGQDLLTPDVAFLTYKRIKGEGISKKDVIAFLDRYYEEEHTEKLSDKKVYKAYIDEKLAYYSKEVETFPYNKGFAAKTVVSLKDYNAETGVFSLELEHYLARGIINPSDKWGGKLDYVAKAENYASFVNLKMDCAKIAELFVNNDKGIEKDSIHVTVSFSFYSAVTEEINQFGSSELFTGYIMCKINSLTYHLSNGEDLVVKP